VKKYLDYAISMGIFAAVLAYYWAQLCPTFYFWDSAELAAAVASGGLPHPPGFPLYLILVKLFCLAIPMDIGAASGLFSAVCGAAACALLYLVLIKLISGYQVTASLARLLALGGSICLAVSASLTAQSTRAEVYSLNLLLFMAGLYFLADYFNPNRGNHSSPKYFLAACLLLGLGLANHHLTILVTMPGLIYLAIKSRLNIKAIIAGAVAFVIPLSLYYYLIILAGHNPDLNWGNPKTIGDLFAVISGKGFNKPVAAFSMAHLAENYGFDISLLYRQLGPLMGVSALVGIMFAWIKNRIVSGYFLLCLIFNMLSTVFNEMYYYENADIHGYLLISLVCLIVFGIFGIIAISNKFGNRARWYLIAVISTISIAIPAYGNRGWGNLSGNLAAKKLATSIMDKCPRNSLVVTSSYNSFFILKAAQHVYGYRTDLRVVNVYLFGQKWYRESIVNRCNLQHFDVSSFDNKMFYRDLINFCKDSSEIYIEYDDQSAPLKNYLSPSGLLMKFNNRPNDWAKINKTEFVENDLREFYDFVEPGMDYELLKSVILMLDGRYNYFKAVGQPDLAERYLAAIDKIAEVSQR
jgi:hypothetical protein